MRTAELRRNLWLELSPQRVIALPLIVLVVVLMQQATGGGNAQLAQVGSWLYFGMVLLWAVIIVVPIVLVRFAITDRRIPAPPTPEQVLADRFARGEISETEYRDRLAVLRDRTRA